jgi:hypothetical protein
MRTYDFDPLNDMDGYIDLHEAMTRAASSTYARQLLENFDIDGFAHDGDTYDTGSDLLALSANGGDAVAPSDRISGWYSFLYGQAA